MPTDQSVCPVPEKLEDLLANRLPLDEAQSIREHIQDCPSCRGRIYADTVAAMAGTRTGPRSPVGSAVDFLSPPLQEGDLGSLAGYRILSILGEGGMGIVYEADEPALHRRVALKVLRPALVDKAMRERFIREAQLLASMPHEHIVTIHHVGEANGVPFLTMERLEGETLAQRVGRDGTVPLAEALRITREAAEGLAVVHEHGMIHRDIKPGNLWLESRHGRFYRVKLLDFGIARPQSQHDSLTRTGAVVGTPLYMAPEQAAAVPLDGRADLYSLGCVLFNMLTGTLPFLDQGNDTMALLRAAASGDRPKVSGALANLSPALALLLEQLLSPMPAGRPASARVVVERLRQIESGSPSGPPTPQSSAPPAHLARRLPIGGLVLGSVLILATLVVGAFYASSLLFPRAGKGGTAAGVNGPPIKVGILHSLTGTLSGHERPVVQGVIMAIEEINAEGGVLGRLLEPIQRDGASDETVFAQEARKLLAEDGAEVLFGCWTSSSRKRVAEVCKEFDRLLFYSVMHEGLETSRNVVYLGGTPNQTLLPMVRWAYADKRKRRYFLLGSDHVYSRTVAVMLRHEIEALGATVCGDEFVPLDETQFADIVAKIKSSRADILVNTIDGQANVFLFQTLRGAGLDPKTLSTVWVSLGEGDLSGFPIRKMVGDYSVGCYFDSIKGEANQAFLERFRKRYGTGERVNDVIETAYAGVYAWKKAIELAETTDLRPVRRALRKLHIDAPEGPIDLDDNLHAYRTARVGQIEVKDRLARFRIVFTSPEPLPPDPFPAWQSQEKWEALLANLYKRWGNKWEKHR